MEAAAGGMSGGMSGGKRNHGGSIGHDGTGRSGLQGACDQSPTEDRFRILYTGEI